MRPWRDDFGIIRNRLYARNDRAIETNATQRSRTVRAKPRVALSAPWQPWQPWKATCIYAHPCIHLQLHINLDLNLDLDTARHHLMYEGVPWDPEW